ncbi:MAG: DHHW family protein [Clostridia bacterium]
MEIKRLLGALLGLVLLAAVIAISIFSTQELSEIKAEAVQPTPTPTYGEQGLPYGMQLDTAPYLIEDGYAFFKDRIVPLYKRNNETLLTYADTTARFLASLPQNVRSYIMLIPTRAAFEESLSAYTDDENAAINDIGALMPAGVTCVNLIKTLAAHKSEYIYFRTDDSWTAQAARYAALAYANKAGLELPQLDEYYYYNILESHKGILYEINGHEIPPKLYDYVAFYTPIYGKNLQTVTLRHAAGQYETHDSPAVALSRRSKNIFIAPYFSHSILHGDKNNGKTVVIFGSSEAKLFAPWLTPVYENVILISAARYQDGVEGFRKLFEDYNVTDFIFMQSITSPNDSPGSKADKLILNPDNTSIPQQGGDTQ